MKRSISRLLITMFLSGALQPLFGTDFKAGEKVIISETVRGDLYIGAGDIEIWAPVLGDLVASGGEISVEDSVMQDLLIAGGELFLNGFVGDDIRAAGGKVTVTSIVIGDVVVFGGQVDIDGTIYGDLIVYGGDVEILGTVKGNVKAAGGKIYLKGVVDGNAEFKAGTFETVGEIKGSSQIIAEDIYVGEGAKFHENVTYWRKDGVMDFGSSLINASAHYNAELKGKQSRDSWGMAFSALVILYILSIILIIVLLNFLMNRSLSLAAENLNNEPLQALVYGIVYFLGLPIVIFLLLLTVIGIPIGLLMLAIYIFSWVFGLSMASVITARIIKIKYHYQQWGPWILVLVSFGIFAVFKIITLIPFIGWLGYLLILAMAYGALLFDLKPNKFAKVTE